MLVRVLGVAGVVMAALVSAGPAAEALSCAYGNAPAHRVLAGEAPAVAEESLLETYDVAVVGRVTLIETDEDQGQAYGRTRISLAVDAAFGGGEIGSVFVVEADDPGWMSGYAFETGKRYFVPVVERGPQGQRNYSFACDPISELGGRDDIARLVRVAGREGIAVALPGDTTSPASPPPTAAADRGGAPSLDGGGALSLAGVAAVVGAAALVLHRRGGV